MNQHITWVGIDDHKLNLFAAVVRGTDDVVSEPRRIANDDRSLQRWLRRLERESAGGEIRICYKAGPNGFALKRRLEALGPVRVDVIAPTLTPRRTGQRVKTDKVDAAKRVRWNGNGNRNSNRIVPPPDTPDRT